MKAGSRIGVVQFRDDEIRIAVVKTGSGRPSVLEFYTERPVHDPAAENVEDEKFNARVNAVRTVLDRLKNRPALYVLCASSEWAVVRLLQIPFKGRRRVAAAVQFELEPYLAFPIDELVVDYLPVREVDGQTVVLAVGMRAQHLAEQTAVLEAAGVIVEGIGVDGGGQTGLWHSLEKKLSGLNAVLHVRPKSALLAVTYEKRLAYIRHVPLGHVDFQEQPMAAAKEVNKLLRAFLTRWVEFEGGGDSARETVIQSLTLTGADLFEEERNLFEEGLAHLEVEIRYSDPFDTVKGARAAYDGLADEEDKQVEDSAADRNAWFGLIGVADSAAGGLFNLNFQKGALQPESTFKTFMPHIVFSSCLAALVILGYIGYCYVDYRRNVAEIDRIGQEVYENFAAAYPEHEAAQQRPPNDVGGIRTHAIMAEAIEGGPSARERLSVELFNKPTLLDILREVAEIMPDEKVTIRQIKMESGRRPTISIAGDAQDAAKFDEVYADLRKSELLDVIPERLSRQSLGGRETFVITAQVAEGGDDGET